MRSGPHSRGDHGKRYALLPVTLSASFVFAQTADNSKDPVFSTVPFDRWIAQGDHTDVPWKVQIRSPELDDDQRLMVTASITIDGKSLDKHPPGGDLLSLMQVEDSQGHVYQSHGTLSLKDLNRDVRRADIIYTHQALVISGEYRITLALLNTFNGDHNLLRATVHAEPLQNDPLPKSWEGLPVVEILDKENTAEPWFHPELTGRLHLPVENRMPLRIELLVKLPPWSGRRAYISRWYLGTMIPQLEVISAIKLRNGTVNITLLDVPHRRALAVTRHGQPLDGAALESVLQTSNPDVVDVSTLAKPIPVVDFLTEEIGRRLADKSEAKSEAGEKTEPRVVFIFMGLNDDYGKNPSWTPPLLNQVPVEREYWIRDYPSSRERVMATTNWVQNVGGPEVIMTPTGPVPVQQPLMLNGPSMGTPTRPVGTRPSTASFYFADSALSRLDTPHAWREPFVLGTLSTTSFLRGAFSLATMSHFFLLALHTAFPRLAFHLWTA
jgi:hypothetical protein